MPFQRRPCGARWNTNSRHPGGEFSAAPKIAVIRLISGFHPRIPAQSSLISLASVRATRLACSAQTCRVNVVERVCNSAQICRVRASV